MIYGICGKKRTGKDTVANIIIDTHRNVRSIALADEIKAILKRNLETSGNAALISLARTNPFYTGDREAHLVMSNEDAQTIFTRGVKQLNERGFFLGGVESIIWRICEENRKPWTIRRLMQVFGTDIVCETNDSVWTEILLRKILKSPEDHFIITDVRQPHEYKYLSKFGVKYVFIERDTNGEEDSHPTENGLTPRESDTVLINNGTIAELTRDVLETFKFSKSV